MKFREILLAIVVLAVITGVMENFQQDEDTKRMGK